MKKVDFKNVKGLLTREQMKKVIGGAYAGGSCCLEQGMICQYQCCLHSSTGGCGNGNAFCAPGEFGCGAYN